MRWLLVVLVVSACGAGCYWAGRRAAQEQHRRQLPSQWRDGHEHGYQQGWTAGRRALLAEETAKAHHPTAHPLAQAARAVDHGAEVVDLEQRRVRRNDEGA